MYTKQVNSAGGTTFETNLTDAELIAVILQGSQFTDCDIRSMNVGQGLNFILFEEPGEGGRKYYAFVEGGMVFSKLASSLLEKIFCAGRVEFQDLPDSELSRKVHAFLTEASKNKH